MRNIEFKGLTKNEPNTWVYGYLLPDNNIYQTRDEEKGGKGVFSIIPESVGQYTGRRDKHNVKIYENDMVLCFLDINPLSSGHTLIIHKKHFKDISDIDSKYLSSINDATKYVYNLLMSKLGPDGIRIVQNNGICQEIKHYHVHLIPVYNDMLDMDIEEVYNKIKDSN